jgi:hypothetical protein
MKKEQYLRVHLWWAVNDIVRRNANAQIPTRYVQKLHENLAGFRPHQHEGPATSLSPF